MIKTFRSGNQIKYSFGHAGDASLSISNNISGYVFSGPTINGLKKQLKEVSHFSEKVGVLSANSFDGCENLTTMNLFGSSVSSVGSNCFRGCSQLTSFFGSKEQRSIPSNCFYGDVQLKFAGFKKYESDKDTYDQ